MTTTIRFRANHKKILEGLVWIARQCPQKGFHFILKTLFYADKWHLQRYGRPVFGDIYVKMPFGPVASIAYDLLKFSDFVPAELLNLAEDAIQVDRKGRVPSVTAKRDPDESLFSGTDIECLKEALDKCSSMDFNQLTEATHEETAWSEAEMNGEMSWEKIIDIDTPNREDLIQYISETSQCLAL